MAVILWRPQNVQHSKIQQDVKWHWIDDHLQISPTSFTKFIVMTTRKTFQIQGFPNYYSILPNESNAITMHELFKIFI